MSNSDKDDTGNTVAVGQKPAAGLGDKLLQSFLILAGLVISLLGLLLYLPAPDYNTWKYGLIAGEFSPWVTIVAGLLLTGSLIRLRFSRAAKLAAAGSVLLGIGTVLFVAPSLITVSQAAGQGIPLDFGQALFGSKLPAPTVIRDLKYKSSDGTDMTLDVYMPANSQQEDRRPAVIVVHGGGWNHGHKSDLTRIDDWLTAQGYIVVDIDYHLASNETRFPIQIDDLDKALEWTKMHAGMYRIDQNRIALLGRSAGGHMVMAAAYRHPDPSIKGVVSFYGPTDLVWGYNNIIQPDVLDAHFLLENFLGGTPEAVPETYAKASPLKLASAKSPATIMLHGTFDQLVSFKHSEFLQRRLQELNVPCQLVLVNQATHVFDANLDGLHSQIAFWHLKKFLADTFAKPASEGDKQ